MTITCQDLFVEPSYQASGIWWIGCWVRLVAGHYTGVRRLSHLVSKLKGPIRRQMMDGDIAFQAVEML